MKHAGKAGQAGRRMILWTLVLIMAVLGGGLCAIVLGSLIAVATSFLIGMWFLFALFTLYFFRDPTPSVPKAQGLYLSPCHGTVTIIDEVEEPEFMKGRCQRISVFLSIFDVHVQKAPISGVVNYMQYHEGEFLNAMKPESAARNENVLIGFDSSEEPGERIGVRLIAGVIARRIVPWIAEGDAVERGERVSLIQFGSRCDLYAPLSARIEAKLGDKVIGGQTILARRG